MNNIKEIKEIKIKTIGQLLDYVETEEKARELIDYITNLQEELKKKDNRIHALEKHNEKLNKEAQKYFDLLMECEYGEDK